MTIKPEILAAYRELRAGSLNDNSHRRPTWGDVSELTVYAPSERTCRKHGTTKRAVNRFFENPWVSRYSNVTADHYTAEQALRVARTQVARRALGFKEEDMGSSMLPHMYLEHGPTIFELSLPLKNGHTLRVIATPSDFYDDAEGEFTNKYGSIFTYERLWDWGQGKERGVKLTDNKTHQTPRRRKYVRTGILTTEETRYRTRNDGAESGGYSYGDHHSMYYNPPEDAETPAMANYYNAHGMAKGPAWLEASRSPYNCERADKGENVSYANILILEVDADDEVVTYWDSLGGVPINDRDSYTTQRREILEHAYDMLCDDLKALIGEPVAV